MTRNATFALTTITVLVLLFGYHTSTSSSMTSDTVAVTPVTSGPAGSTGSSGSSSTAGSSTVTGDTVRTRWGPVQVELTVTAGRITAVAVPVYPNGNHEDEQINSYALPILVQSTIDAQSAHIDMVSGATVTSGGYLQSLQSAIDQAGL